MHKQTSKEVIEQLLSLQGAEVVDVGCGDGTLARMMARRGAHVIGIEVSPRQLARARAAPQAGDERYLQGCAEDLPLGNQSADIVVFFNSLHHVHVGDMPKALKEAGRVLRRGGVLFVSEPLAEGPYFEVMKPVHDETLVRRKAQEVLRRAPEYGLLQERVLTHIDTVRIKDFDAFHDRITTINPEVRERFLESEEELRGNFEQFGQKLEDGWAFDQPTRVHLFRRT
jgi:hypothetical protein